MDRLESVEGECSYACDCVRLGTLRKALIKVNFLPSGREPPFSGISFISLQNSIRDMKKVTLPFEQKEETKEIAATNSTKISIIDPRTHACRYTERINIEMEGIGQGIRGFELEDMR